MWLPVIICIGVVALLLGPIMMMQPSADQRRLSHLRETAMKLGLRVHLQVPPKGTQCPKHIKTLPMYCLPWDSKKKARHMWSLAKQKYTHELHYFQEWQQAEGDTPPPVAKLGPLLSVVPVKAVAISAGPQGLGLFWNEFGSEDTVVEITEWLKQAAQAIQTVPVKETVTEQDLPKV